MDINILAIVIATIAQFAIGAFWYTVLFGNLWGRIHGFEKLSKSKQKEMMSQMGPYYGIQLAVTIITTVSLAQLLMRLPDYSGISLAIILWLGFIVPTQISSVIFGGTDPKWITKKIAVLSGGSLLCILSAALILVLFS